MLKNNIGILSSNDGKEYQFRIPEDIDLATVCHQRHGPHSLLIFGSIRSHLPTEQMMKTAIGEQSLNLDWKPEQPLVSTIDDQMKLLGPIRQGYATKLEKVYSKAPISPKYPEALVRTDSIMNEAFWEAYVCCAMFNHYDVDLRRADNNQFYIEDYKHQFAVNLDVPEHIDPDSVELQPLEESTNRLQRHVIGFAYKITNRQQQEPSQYFARSTGYN
ncbi:uncharacterized protein LOC142351805 isoform X2 [Convolutriloba macropyga]|uniref:uncharacterized protein LOC142351805 isoform X2 n=1 Tax=Convolutriloba macropyga TaxID=536237 RepID=UPI003F5222FE